jgi:hypothetical protein
MFAIDGSGHEGEAGLIVLLSGVIRADAEREKSNLLWPWTRCPLVMLSEN